jgi:WD40 repeat protein
MGEFRYDAFISYATATDYNCARKTEAFLEAFHKTPGPAGVTIRKLQICRDGSDFRLPTKEPAGAHASDRDPVWQTILSELCAARYLLVLCSPEAVQSPWVNKEIAWMRKNRGDEWILPALTSGFDPKTKPEECFPAGIREANLHLTRIWYDFRGTAKSPVASKAHNYEDELVRLAGDLLEWPAAKYGPLAAVWEREQLRRRRNQAKIAFAIASVLIAIAGVAIWEALVAQGQAQKARANALVHLAEASFDPCTAALLLTELADEEEPEGGVQAAEKLASEQLPIATMRGHIGRIIKIGFSPDQQRILTASSDGTARIWPVDGRGDPIVLSGHTKGIRDACFNHDGTLVATASADQAVRLWRWDTKEAPREFPHDAEVDSVQFSFDSRWLATIAGGKAEVWRISDHFHQRLTLPDGVDAARFWLDPKELKGWIAAKDGSVWGFLLNSKGQIEVRADEGRPNLSEDSLAPRWEQVAFSVDGSSVVFAAGQEVITRKCGTADRPAALAHKATVNSIALNGDGSRIVTAAADGKLRIWVPGQSEPEREIDSNLRYWSANLFENGPATRNEAPNFNQVLFSDSGKRIAALCDDGVIRLWSVQGAEPPVEMKGHLGADVISFSGDEKRIATGADDGTARVWSLDPPAEPVILAHPKQVYAASFSPDGTKVISSCADGIVRVWPLAGQDQTMQFDAHHDGAPKFAVNRAFDLVACAYEDGVVRLWKTDTPSAPHREFKGHTKPVSGVRFSPDESQVLTWSEDGSVRLWPVNGTGSSIVFDSNAGRVWNAAFDQAGRLVIAAYDDGTARVWSVAEPNHFVLLDGREGHTSSVLDAAISPDGRTVLTVSKDGTTLLWESKGLCAPRVLIHSKVQDEWLEHCAWTRDGKAFAAASSACRLWVWKQRWWYERQMALRRLGDLAHVGSITGLMFSSDGKQLLTGGSVDGIVRLWHIDGSERPIEFFGAGIVTDARFSPDGKRVLGAIESGTVKIWRSDWRELTTFLRSRTSATLTTEQRASLLGEDEKTARSVYEAQERKFARTPLPPNWTFQYPF